MSDFLQLPGICITIVLTDRGGELSREGQANALFTCSLFTLTANATLLLIAH
jgi:hypothetical protein